MPRNPVFKPKTEISSSLYNDRLSSHNEDYSLYNDKLHQNLAPNSATIYYCDEQNGEIVGKNEVLFSREEDEGDYAKVFYDMDARILKKPLLLEIIFMLSKYMTYAGEQYVEQIVFIDDDLRRIIAKQCGISEGTVRNSVTELARIGALRKIKKGKYAVNPYNVGRGAKKKIQMIRKVYDDKLKAEAMKNDAR